MEQQKALSEHQADPTRAIALPLMMVRGSGLGAHSEAGVPVRLDGSLTVSKLPPGR